VTNFEHTTAGCGKGLMRLQSSAHVTAAQHGLHSHTQRAPALVRECACAQPGGETARKAKHAGQGARSRSRMTPTRFPESGTSFIYCQAAERRSASSTWLYQRELLQAGKVLRYSRLLNLACVAPSHRDRGDFCAAARPWTATSSSCSSSSRARRM
jgi:hypothetical protein